MSKGYDYIRSQMKHMGLLRPKRKGRYEPRVQLVAKVPEHIQNKIILLAYEYDISVGELMDLVAQELLDSVDLLKACLRRRKEPEWAARLKNGHEMREPSKTVVDYCQSNGIPLPEVFDPCEVAMISDQ